MIARTVMSALLALQLSPLTTAAWYRTAERELQPDDDAAVLKAIIEETVLPKIRRRGGPSAATPVALVAGQSIPICNVGSSPPCRIPPQWQTFLTPDASRNWPGLIPDSQQRNALVASLETRNQMPHALPAIDHPMVVLTAPRQLELAVRRYLASAVGFASFSWPGYSDDGFALVYGSYGCGSLCGYSWLFVLQKVGRDWRVQSATITAIS